MLQIMNKNDLQQQTSLINYDTFKLNGNISLFITMEWARVKKLSEM